MNIVRLQPSETRANIGFTHKITVSAADVAALDADSDSIALLPVTAGMAVLRVGLRLVTPFTSSDEEIITLDLELGDDGAADTLLAATDLLGEPVTYAAAQPNLAYTASNTLHATLTVAVEEPEEPPDPLPDPPELSTVDAGELDIYLHLVDLNALEAIR